MGRAGCTVVGNIVAGLLANSSLFSLLLVQALAHVVVLVSQVIISDSEDLFTLCAHGFTLRSISKFFYNYIFINIF